MDNANRRDPLHSYYPIDSKLRAIADAVENGLRDALAIYHDKFHPRPEDLVYKIYGIMDEDLSDLILEITKNTKSEIKSKGFEINYDRFTIQDLINIIYDANQD